MGWISAKEKLPRHGQRVLLFTPYNVLGRDHLCIGNKTSIRTCMTKSRGREVPVFTHWMPLPGVPLELGSPFDATASR